MRTPEIPQTKNSKSKFHRAIIVLLIVSIGVWYSTMLVIAESSSARTTDQELHRFVAAQGGPGVSLPLTTTTPFVTPSPTATDVVTATPTATVTMPPSTTETPAATATFSSENAPRYLPAIIAETGKVWQQIDSTFQRDNARSIAVCPDNESIRYLGTDDGLFEWTDTNGSESTASWQQVIASEEQPIPGSVRQIVFGEGCSEVIVAALESGIWWLGNNGDEWQQLGADDDRLISSRTVIWRNGIVYAGTDTGILSYDLGQQQDGWVSRYEGGAISRMSKAGDRIFAGVWTVGVAHNDVCTDQNCQWGLIPAPAVDGFIRDVVGRPPNQGEPPTWLVLATATTAYKWDGTSWQVPGAGGAPVPTGNVFSLARSSEKTYAGVEDGGVWISLDDGSTWRQLGDLRSTVRDMSLLAQPTTYGTEMVTFYVATFENGVWK